MAMACSTNGGGSADDSNSFGAHLNMEAQLGVANGPCAWTTSPTMPPSPFNGITFFLQGDPRVGSLALLAGRTGSGRVGPGRAGSGRVGPGRCDSTRQIFENKIDAARQDP